VDTITGGADARLLRPTELAERWGTSVGRLANWRSKGEGPGFVRLGAAVRYRLVDIEQFEADNFVQGAA
jgi:predicted DNA-binding transcriptional regulator AlpA